VKNKEFREVLKRLCLGIKASPEAKKRIKENVMKKLPLVLLPLLILILLLGGCDSSQAEESQGEIAKLQIEVDEGLSQIEELQIELIQAEANLANFSLPRNFNDEAELIEWRETTGIVGSELSWVDSCVLLHEIALKEGYLVTLDLDVEEGVFVVSLTAIAGERFYLLYPDEIEVYFMAFVY